MHRVLLFLVVLRFPLFVQAQGLVTFKSSNSDLTKSFDWAKSKALSYANDSSDPVGYWY